MLRSRLRNVYRLVGVVAVTVTALAAPSAQASQAGSDEPASLAFVLWLPRSEAHARLQTMAAVLREATRPGMALAGYALAPETTHAQLLYGRIPDVRRPDLPAEPRRPDDPTPIQVEYWKRAHARWERLVEERLRDWQIKRKQLARAWADRRAGALRATPVRSRRHVDPKDLSASLYRCSAFYSVVHGRPILLVIADLSRTPPPRAALLEYQLAHARVLLVGWTLTDPVEYEAHKAAWRGFLRAEGAETVDVLPKGLDPATEIVAWLAKAAS